MRPDDVLPGAAPDHGRPAAVVRRAGAGIAFRREGDGPDRAVVNVNEYGIERRTTLELGPVAAAVYRDLTGRADPTPVEALTERLGADGADGLVDQLITAGFLRPV